MNSQILKAVAFDCDGVMFDSSAANEDYYNHILRNFDFPTMTAEQREYIHMHTVHEALAFLLRDDKLIEAAERFRRKMSILPYIRKMTMEPNLRSLLAKLRFSYKTAIATNRVDSMDRVLSEHRLEGEFDLVVTAGDVTYAKPHPEQLLRILSHFGIEPFQLVYIGDSELDASAARRAQVPFIAFRNPLLRADGYIDNLSQLLPLLETG